MSMTLKAVFENHKCGVERGCWSIDKPAWKPGENRLEFIPCPRLLEELKAAQPKVDETPEPPRLAQHKMCVSCNHCMDCARCQGKERPGE